MKWKPTHITKLRNMAELRYEAYDISQALGKGYTTAMVKEKAQELGIKLVTSKRKSYMKSEPMDDYDLRVVEAYNSGCRTSGEVVKYTRYNTARIKEIAKRLRLKISFEAFDNQSGQIVHYGIGTSQRSYR